MLNGIKARQKWHRSSDIVNIHTAFETNRNVKIMTENISKETAKNKVENANKFRSTVELVEDLLKYFGQYKTTKEFKAKDFNADNPRQNKEVRGLIVKIDDSYATLFGAGNIPNKRTDPDEDETEKTEEEERTTSCEEIKQGYKRIMEKIKKMRQRFSNAVTNGIKGGSGKIVLDHYDPLTNLFSCSASVEPLKFGLENSPSSISTNINSPAIYLEKKNNTVSDVTNDASGSILADVEGDSPTPNISSTPKFSNKKKGDDENFVPRLIDNKGRHLEKRLSRSKSDEMSRKQKGRACLKWNSVKK